MGALLHLNDVESFYGASQVLFGMSLEIQEGEMITLLGRNGMGKTTTVRTIMGLVPAHAGAIRYRDLAIHQLPSFRIAKLGLGLVPEGRQIFPNLSVRENLTATAGNRNRSGNPWVLDRIYELFPLLRERQGNLGNQLSGGEQQMLAIARALMTNPGLLILDEATEGLAPLVRADIWKVLEMLKSEGQSILVIDKNVDILSRIADRHYIIEKGRVVWTGSSTELRADETIRHRYLGV